MGKMGYLILITHYSTFLLVPIVSCLVLIHDKVLGQYVGVTQALQHGVHEASVSVIPQTSYSRRLICGPLIMVMVPTQRWNTVILLLLLLLLHGNR